MSKRSDRRAGAAGDRPLRRLALLASIVVAFLAAANAPGPLYQRYDVIWHGTALTTTIAYAIYALTVLAGLLSLGRLATHFGRRPLLLAALGTQALAVLLFATADSFAPLLLGRALQGLATGAALGTLGAAMIEIHHGHGTVASAAAPSAGTGIGTLAAALAVGYLPWPTRLIYLILLAVFAIQAVAVARLPERAVRQPGVLASLRPRIAVPRVAGGAFLTAAPVLFAVWAMAGFYGSLGPALSRQLAGTSSAALGGVGMFILAGVASVATILLRNASARSTMNVGVATLIVGVAATIVAIQAGSITGYFAATAIAGIGFGAGFQGGLRTVTALAEPSQQAGLLSALFVVSYLGMGVPAVLAGYLVSHGASLAGVAVVYAMMLILLALAAASGLLRQPLQRDELGADDTQSRQYMSRYGTGDGLRRRKALHR
jgi:predicted MFS family arabinose efflux permease